MKFRLTQTIAFVILLQVTLFAQETKVNEPTQSKSLCLNFPTPVIKPEVDENKPPIVKPDSIIDFKLIIISPCVCVTEQPANSLFSVVPKTKDE
jgi:hypothetical protein